MTLLALLLTLASPSAHAADVVLTKAQFLDGMKAKLPDGLCGDTSYFRKCFNATLETCKKEMGTTLTMCIAATEAGMPAQLQTKDGQDWGGKLGSCAGEKYESNLVKTKLTTADCKDPEKWKF